MIRDWYRGEILSHLSSKPDDDDDGVGPNLGRNEEEKKKKKKEKSGPRLLQVGSENFAEEFLGWMGKRARGEIAIASANICLSSCLAGRLSVCLTGSLIVFYCSLYIEKEIMLNPRLFNFRDNFQEQFKSEISKRAFEAQFVKLTTCVNGKKHILHGSSIS